MASDARPGPPAGSALTSFVGRRTELGQLRALLSGTRLVTITGPGGAGKTRLAEELAGGLARSFASTAVAYLAAALEPSDIVEVVASALGLRNRGERPVRAELAQYLADRRVLLVLDNCEHLATAVAALAMELLAGCPRLVIVSTSRQPLYVPGEQLFGLGGLARDAAVELFVDRARLGLPQLLFDDAADVEVDQICSRLDDMPLAIELAAAQVRGLGLPELRRRLADHVADLASRSSVGPERQRTLRQAVAWSHELLTPDQAAVWRRLAVFSGGFTLGAAEEVAAFAPIDQGAIAGILTDLVDQSMLIFDPGTARYRLLEVLREFAHERLRDAGEERAAEDEHRGWMVAIAIDTDRRWFGPDQPALMDRMEAEVANLRAALERCASAGGFDDGLRLSNGGYWYWLTRAGLEEGVRWYRRFLGRATDRVLDGRAHWRAGYLSTIRLDFAAAHEFLDGALARSPEDDGLDRVYITGISGLLMLYEHPERAEEARALCRTMFEDPAADSMAREWGHVGYGLASLAVGDLEECRASCEAGAEIGRQVGEHWGRELCLRFLGQAEWRLGRHDAAERALLECLRLDRELGDLWHTAWSTEVLAWVAVDRRELERAARLLGIAAAVWDRTRLRLGFPFQQWHDAALETLRARLGSVRLEAELAVGRALSPAGAFAFALRETSPLAPGPGARASGPSLSERELEVAALIAAGLGNRSIAERLFLSPRTVEKHVQHVMDKLGLDSRTEIAAWYERRSRAGV